MISVVILTLNEEVNLPRCLASLRWCDDVIVFDSFSSDRTALIAEEWGARVIKREFDDYASQRQAALNTGFKHQWVYMADADEEIPPDLAEEMLATVQLNGDSAVVLYRLLRKDMFLGRWLRRSTAYPTWAGRLFRADKISIERPINEEFHAVGETGKLKGHFIHHPFSKGVAHWIDRHNRYSSMEAVRLLQERGQAIPYRNILSRDSLLRRKALKQVAYRMPLRPLVVFLYLFVLRGGFLDGAPGLYYSGLRSFYELMIDLKIIELRRRREGLPV